MNKEFLIRINYKSGIQEEVWVTEFKYSDYIFSWEYLKCESKRILILGADNVESVYKLDEREL